MAKFKYIARDSTGRQVIGEREAETVDSLADILMQTGITPLDISEVKIQSAGAIDIGEMLGFNKPKTDDLILFCRQIYAITKAGVPIVRGLTQIASSTRNKHLSEVLHTVVSDLGSGRDFSSSLAKHTDVFSPLFINVVRVGEETGKLDEAFLRIHAYLDTDKVTADKIKAALRYPMFVFIAISIAIGIITVKVIPTFAKIFENYNLDLPLQTRIIIGISNFAADYWWVILLLITGFVLWFRNWKKTDEGRLRWHGIKLHLPKIGDIILRATLARYARALSMAGKAGVPILQGLSLSARATENDVIEQAVLDMRTDVERGESLTAAAHKTELFTPLVLQMLAIGEETGQVDEMMDEVADFYEREVAYDIDNLSSIIEPIMTVVMGLLVLVLALGVFLPMWDLVQITKQ